MRSETFTRATLPKFVISRPESTEPLSGMGLGTAALSYLSVTTFVTVNWPTNRVNVFVNRKPLALATHVNVIGVPQAIVLGTR